MRDQLATGNLKKCIYNFFQRMTASLIWWIDLYSRIQRSGLIAVRDNVINIKKTFSTLARVRKFWDRPQTFLSLVCIKLFF